jgi:tRNA G18 (ribose-2'-O)-methylase SpoU
VLETLTAARWPVLELFTSDTLAADILRPLQTAAADQSVPWQRVSSARLEQLCRQADHQGVAARMGEFPVESAADLSVAVRESSAIWSVNASAPSCARRISAAAVCDAGPNSGPLELWSDSALL